MSEEFAGTREDNTMTIEGDGATRISSIDMPRESGLPKGASTVHPCEKWGHHPKIFVEDGIQHEATPRICRHCGAHY